MSAGRMTPESHNGRSHYHSHHGHGPGQGHHTPHNDHHGAAGGSRRPQQDWAQINDWEVHRDRITELYRDQGLHLKQVQKIMAEQHQFYASQRMYKTRISKWAIDKNLKAADVATLLRLQQQRAALGKKSRFTIRGREIDFARVDQYLKRDPTLLKRSQHGEDTLGDILPGHMEAAGITCRTPSPTPPPSPSPPAQHYQQRQPHHHHDPYYGGGHGHHQLHYPYHSHHQTHNPYGHHSQFAATVPIVPSHTPMPMVTTASTFPTLTSMSPAPFTTTQGTTIPSLSLPTASLPYMPLHTTHSMSSFDQHHHQQRTLPSQHAAAYDARRNSIANPLLSSVHQSSLPNASNMSNIAANNISPYISASFPPLQTAAQTPNLFASPSPVSNEASIQDDLTRLTREYVMKALHQGMWVKSSGNSMTNINNTFISTKTKDGSGAEAADRLAAWGRELQAGRRLIADGMLEEGFESVHHTMDNLRQHLQDEDPSLLFYLLYSTAFGIKCPLDRPRHGRDSTAELRQVSSALGSHVRSLTHIVLGEQHPIARMMHHLVANDGRLRSPSHMAALVAPLVAMRDLLAEHDPVGVDPAAATMCQRLAFLLRLDRSKATASSDAEREDLTERLQGARNLHTRMQFYTTYMTFLSELAQQQDREQRNKAAAVQAWSGGADLDLGGGGVAVTTAGGLSTLTPAYSSASDCGATPESAYTTATATVTADNAYQHGKPTLAPVLTGLHSGLGQAHHGHTPVSNMHSPMSNGGGSSRSSARSSPSPHSLPMAGVSSAMIPPPPKTTMNTPRTILSGGQHHHSQQHGHSPYTLQPSAYPPVPTAFHSHGGQTATGMTLAVGHEAALAAHNLAGQHQGSNAQMAANSMNDPGSMTWELGDAADMDWA